MSACGAPPIAIIGLTNYFGNHCRLVIRLSLTATTVSAAAGALAFAHQRDHMPVGIQNGRGLFSTL
jgi:hypothetical protein